MDPPETNKSYTKRDMEEGIVGNSDRAGDGEELDGTERRGHRTSKSRRSRNGEELHGWDSSGRKTLRERTDERKRSSGSSTGGSDEGEYDTRKDLRSKPVKRKAEESTLEKLSNWYQDGELEGRHDGGNKYGNRGHPQVDESVRNFSRKTTSKFSGHEGLQTRSRAKDEKSHDGVYEKGVDRDSRSSERRESSREKGHGSSEMGRDPRKRLVSDVPRKAEEGYQAEKTERSGEGSGSKRDNSRERSTYAIPESIESKSRGLEANSDGVKSYSQEERNIDLDKHRGRSRFEYMEEDTEASALPCNDRSGGGKSEKYKEQRIAGCNAAEFDKSSNPEECGKMSTKDKNGREVGHSRRSRTPDRSGRYWHDVEKSEEYDRSSSLKHKELDMDGYGDDRSQTKDDNWSDRNRDREGYRDSWKMRQPIGFDKDGDMGCGRDRDWDVTRRFCDRMDNGRPLGRSGNRKDGRVDAVKGSLKFGISTDVIEIQPKPLDYGREDVGSAFGRRNDVQQQGSRATTSDERACPGDDSARTGSYGSSPTTHDVKEKYMSDGATMQDQHAWRDEADAQGGRPRGQLISISNRSSVGPNFSNLSRPPYSNQDSGSFGRALQPGIKGGRGSRTGRVRPSGRDNQQVSIPVPLMGSPFAPLGMPQSGPVQPLNPGMSPAPGPPISHGLLFPPFSPPVWGGARGVDMNLLPLSSGVSSIPPWLPGQRFPPSMGNPSNPALYFNPPGLGRGVPANASGPGFNSLVPVGQGQSHEKGSGGWIPKVGGLSGKAPSRGEQNDYSQNFVDTGMRPQNFIRELELTNVEDYPKLRELIQKKDEIVANASSPPMYYKCDLHEFVLSPEFFGTKFDVILVDPPWEEYVHRAPGVDHMEYWKFEEIMNLKIEAIADTPSFIFLWVGDSVGLEQGRQCLKKWGFRRCEDICWVKTNKHTATQALRHDSHTLFQHSKEHCLMGIKGTVRRSTDGHIIHANIDTDVIISEEPPYGSTAKPDEIYRIIEHFALGRRRIELFGEDHNIRTGWLTVGKGLSSSNFNAQAYCRSFADKDGKVWQGGGGRNPPPDAPHLVQTTPEIESLRPKSPMKNQQQLQQSATISLTTANSSNKRPTGNPPQNPTAFINQDAFKGRDFGNIGPSDNDFGMYGYNMPHVPPNTEYIDFETQRAMNSF